MTEPLTDEDTMPFGKHKGKKMVLVPADYLDWLRGQEWIGDWPALAGYLGVMKEAIDSELPDDDEIPF